MAAPSDQCAVAADGSLLDASQIIFYNDPDDETPLPKDPNSESNSATTSTHLHPFFRGDPAPSKIAGSRRSTCVARPSARITDPNNLEASVTRKRSATVTTSAEGSLRAARRAKLTGSDEESEDDNELDVAEVYTGDDNDVGTSDAMTEEEGVGDSTDVEHAEEAYCTTKAMGDADRQVHLKSLFKHIADNRDSSLTLQFLCERQKSTRTADI